VASQKNILEYFYNEKIIHNAINEGYHINFYGLNINNLLHSNIFRGDLGLGEYTGGYFRGCILSFSFL
jgi:hypothetical protein